MIKVKKTKKQPRVVFLQLHHAHKGKEKCIVFTQRVIDDYKKDPKPFADGEYTFSLDYGYDAFRKKLTNDQGSKCCFCEKPLDGGAVEHFRPKAAWQQKKGDKVINRPGYYWLAYTWDNFILSCSDCNRSGRKGNVFPIGPGGRRAIKPGDSLLKEKQILINPAKTDPSRFITFNLEKPVGKDKNGRGQSNIDVFELDKRPDLTSSREMAINTYKLHLLISKTPVGGRFTQLEISNAKIELKRMKHPKSPFAGMLLENIKKGLL